MEAWTEEGAGPMLGAGAVSPAGAGADAETIVGPHNPDVEMDSGQSLRDTWSGVTMEDHSRGSSVLEGQTPSMGAATKGR